MICIATKYFLLTFTVFDSGLFFLEVVGIDEINDLKTICSWDEIKSVYLMKIFSTHIECHD